MDNNTSSIQVWLAVSPVVILLITQIFGFLDKRVASRSSQQSQQHNKLEDQYQKILAPLHRLLFFGGDWESNIKDQQKLQEAEQIMKDNYFLVPQPLIECWSSKDMATFAEYLRTLLLSAANRLGYGYTQFKDPVKLGAKDPSKRKNASDVRKTVESSLASSPKIMTLTIPVIVGLAFALLGFFVGAHGTGVQDAIQLHQPRMVVAILLSNILSFTLVTSNLMMRSFKLHRWALSYRITSIVWVLLSLFLLYMLYMIIIEPSILNGQ